MLSKEEGGVVLDLMDQSLRCSSEDDLRRLIVRVGSLIPHESALCALSKAGYNSAEPYYLVNVSYPSWWIETYISKRLDRVDPIVREHRLHFGLQYWPDSYEKHPGSKPVMSSACGCGSKPGYSYGLKTPGSEKTSLFCFGGKSMRKDVRTSLLLKSIVPHLHQALVRVALPLGGPRQVSDPGFTSREKEVLQWVKEGKGAWEISMILSISTRTVKFHIRNIMRKVQARNRVQAVAISLENGFIELG
jgi:LuxR family transcriptional regulator, quorum-sensing system regulator CviR